MAVACAVARTLAFAGSLSFAWPGAGTAPDADLTALDQGTRVRAVLELAAMDDARARALLVPALTDRDPIVRETAARVLARRGAPEALEAATAWLSGTVPRERLIGLHVLKDAPELPATARRAAERATRDGDLATRGQALELLARQSPAASFSVVLAALNDEHRDVRARAARVLGDLHDPRAALPLIARLDDGDRLVRAEAIASLGALGERRALPALLRQLDGPTPDLRLPAIDALGALGDPAAAPALARIAARRPLDETARHAMLALGAIGSPEALDALRAQAREPETLDEVREALARAGARALPLLRRELAEGTPSTAALAAELLGMLGDRSAAPWLIAALDQRGPAAPAAAVALARLGEDAAVPALLRAAVAPAGGVELRVAALDALAASRDDRAAEGLTGPLADADAGVRAAAARAAGACGGPALAPALAMRLGDADGRVRLEAARSLARLAAPSSDVARAIAAALARGLFARDAAALAALGDALERSAGPADAAFIEQAYVDVGGRPGSSATRGPLARALAAVHAGGTLTKRAVIDALLGELSGDDGSAAAAADALTTARLMGEQQEALTAAFALAEPGIAARLAPGLARFRAGAQQLTATLRAPDASAVRRAAAAWALAGVAEGQAALREALAAPEPSVAANARAALAAGVRAGHDWAAVRLVTPTGEPWPRQWVMFSSQGGTSPAGRTIWALTDLDGRARVAGAGPAPTVSVPPAAARLPE
jgi:HEAT repeat protein